MKDEAVETLTHNGGFIKEGLVRKDGVKPVIVAIPLTACFSLILFLLVSMRQIIGT